MKVRREVRGALLALVACGCTALPTISAGVCGNGVIEPPEDCDSFSPTADSVCRPKGASGACHLDCQRRSDGTRPACPAGWGCDSDDLCRAPTANFGNAIESTVGSASSLLAADFDGDGRAEVISAPPEDAFQRTHLSFHYFDDRGVLVETHMFPKLLGSPVFTELSGDARSDLVFGGFGVGVLLGRSDRVWVPETFHSFAVPTAHIRMLAVYDDSVQGDSPLLALSTLAGVPGLYLPRNATGRLELRGSLPGPVESLAGAVTGDVIEGVDSPCREVILARRGASAFSVLDVCKRDDDTGAIVWNDRATQTDIALEPPASIEGNFQVADLDGNGHLDVLISASGRPYVSYGDGHRLRTATPDRFDGANGGSDAGILPLPLAMGDFTGDGVVDFVFPDRLVVSAPTPGGGKPTYISDQPNAGAPWTVATIADLNGNGKPDVIAASNAAPRIDFFNGTGTPHLIASNVPTTGAVEQLAVDDFDGDLTNDLAFMAAGSKGDGDSLMIAFGALGALPASPVQVARVRGAEQLSTYHESSIGNLMVSSYERTGARETGTLTLLNGSSDRLPFAPYGLITLSREGVIQSSGALVLTVGAFSAPRTQEVLALAAQDVGDPIEFWLGPSAEAAVNTPLRLEGGLDPRMQPWTTGPVVRKIDVVGASADLDGDGLDESLWLMPADAGQRCGLASAGVTRHDAGQFVLRQTVFLDEPCVAPALFPVDADGDGAVDVALLTGTEGDADRRVLVLWNDGTGTLSADAVTVVSDKGDSPRAFAALRATAAQPFRLAYVTRDAAKVVDASNPRRAFGHPRTIATLEDGTGIVAADVNGDGVLDLAVADAGNVSVLLAYLKTEQ